MRKDHELMYRKPSNKSNQYVMQGLSFIEENTSQS